MATRVAVLGAGPLGLTAIKNLREEGFDVTGFEARSYVGGLWNPSTDSSLSVVESTVFNSSRFRSAFSDYPFDDDVDDYPTWQQMYKYMNGYCDHFGLRPHIQLNSKVTAMTREGNQWVIEVTPIEGPVRREHFDKVIVATGSFILPKSPKIPNIEHFQGRTLHAINFNTPSNYDGQRMLLIGLHATAQDVAKALHGHAEKLYITHRNGIILMPRYFEDGSAFDVIQTLPFVFFHMFMDTWFPSAFEWLFNKTVRSWSKKFFPDQLKSWKFDNAPSVAVTAPLIVDEMYNFMKSGFAEPVDPVKQVVGPKSVELTDGRVLNDIDSIIYCTGYDMVIPFIEPEYNPYPKPGAVGKFYRNIFPLHPDPDVRNSLAYLGHAAIVFPGFIQHEMIAMAIIQTWLGKSPLPSYKEMEAWHKRNLQWRDTMKKSQKTESTFYVVFMRFADHLRYLNWAAGAGVFEHFGWFCWRAWAFWWRDRELYKKTKNGLLTPAIWRLFDMGKRKPWDGAAMQIYKDNEIEEKRKKEMGEKFKKEREEEGKKKV